jgi:hypothetical protein
MKGLIAFYVESKKLEEDLERVIKKHKLITIPCCCFVDRGNSKENIVNLWW